MVGQLVTDEEATCDPMHGNCKVREARYPSRFQHSVTLCCVMWHAQHDPVLLLAYVPTSSMAHLTLVSWHNGPCTWSERELVQGQAVILDTSCGKEFSVEIVKSLLQALGLFEV